MRSLAKTATNVIIPVCYRGFSSFKSNSILKKVELPPLISENFLEYFDRLSRNKSVAIADLPKLEAAKEFAYNITNIAQNLADGGDKKSQEFLQSVEEFKDGRLGVLHVVGMPFSSIDSDLLLRLRDNGSRECESAIIRSHIPMIYATAGIGFMAGYKTNLEVQSLYQRILTEKTSYRPAHCDGAFYDRYKQTDMFSLSVLSLDESRTPTFVLSAKELHDIIPEKFREVLFRPVFYSSYTDNRFPIFSYDERGNLQINFRLEEAMNHCNYHEDPALFSDFPAQSHDAVMLLCEAVKDSLEKHKQTEIEYCKSGDTAFINNKTQVHGVDASLSGNKSGRVLSKVIFQQLQQQEQQRKK